MGVNQNSQLVPEVLMGDAIPRSCSISSSRDAACGKTISRLWQQMKRTVSELGFPSNQTSQSRLSNPQKRQSRSRKSERCLTLTHDGSTNGYFAYSSWDHTSTASVRNRSVPIQIQDPKRTPVNDTNKQLYFDPALEDIDHNMNSTSRVSMNRPDFEPFEDPSGLTDLSVKSDGWYESKPALEDQIPHDAGAKSYQMSRSLGTSGFSTFMRSLKRHFHSKDKANILDGVPADDDEHRESQLGLSVGFGRNYQGIDLSLPHKKRPRDKTVPPKDNFVDDDEYEIIVAEEAIDVLDDTAKTDDIITIEGPTNLEQFESKMSDHLNQVLASTDSGVCMDLDKSSIIDDVQSMYSLQDIDGALNDICDEDCITSTPSLSSIVTDIKIPNLRTELLRSCAIVGALTKDGRELSVREMVTFEQQKPYISAITTV
ncbi:hypothetical protein QAD02_004341 [Eretmocerus hayati]|uniref:Uncharacterized protein n=1 Tax=Eretmocerus hayati TaxID=131215 RepID=A0ACC2NU43_9HYME|nr:hypothetical protein QAD02_004341 [Eretmocerus hayati]